MKLVLTVDQLTRKKASLKLKEGRKEQKYEKTVHNVRKLSPFNHEFLPDQQFW